MSKFVWGIDKKEAMNNLVEIESRFYCCFKCRNVVAIQDDVVDKNFVAGEGGRAFLFSHTMKLKEGTPSDRHLLTGVHNIADVCCSDCGEALGWKYLKAYQEQHMFKVGKTVLIKSKIDKLANPPFH